MRRSALSCRLYLLTPDRLDEGFADRLAAALDAGDVPALQLRLKTADDNTIARAVASLRPVTEARDTALILNDRPDLAAALGCDGAHVGVDDMAVADARRVLGPDRQLGVSCYASRDRAMEAGEQGADYVAFGSFFPSRTKATGHVADTALLAWWSGLMEPPSVAIGGITPENCRPLADAGADFIAVCAAVWSAPEGPAAAVRAFDRALSGRD